MCIDYYYYIFGCVCVLTIIIIFSEVYSYNNNKIKIIIIINKRGVAGPNEMQQYGGRIQKWRKTGEVS